nr:Chain C, Geminin peptide [Homo sapiens]7KLZ_D Chain D, Geminin peptide [Homo sapiens]
AEGTVSSSTDALPCI